jgi:hypothetical protein
MKDAATLTASFRDKLMRLIDEALDDGVKAYILAEVVEKQVTRLNIHAAANKPW